MAIVANLAKENLPTNPVRFVNYATNSSPLDPHINTVNTGCGTDIVGTFPTTDDRGNPDVNVAFFDGVVFSGVIPDQTLTVDEYFELDTGAYFTTDGSAVVYTVTLLNTGLVIDAATGVISGIPTGIGTSNPIVTCTDGANSDDSNIFELAAA